MENPPNLTEAIGIWQRRVAFKDDPDRPCALSIPAALRPPSPEAALRTCAATAAAAPSFWHASKP